jgi:hypothetical protein
LSDSRKQNDRSPPSCVTSTLVRRAPLDAVMGATLSPEGVPANDRNPPDTVVRWRPTNGWSRPITVTGLPSERSRKQSFVGGTVRLSRPQLSDANIRGDDLIRVKAPGGRRLGRRMQQPALMA